jgi:hypothetical protein
VLLAIIRGAERVATENRGRGIEPRRLSIGALSLQFLRRWYSTSALRALLSETGNLRHRIRWSLQIHACWRLATPGLVPREMERFSVSGSGSHRRAYMKYMRRLEVEHPTLTIVDHLLATQSWLAGSSTSAGNSCSSPLQDSLDDSVGGNSMPPVATQQPTKHDPPDQLPSRA